MREKFNNRFQNNKDLETPIYLDKKGAFKLLFHHRMKLVSIHSRYFERRLKNNSRKREKQLLYFKLHSMNTKHKLKSQPILLFIISCWIIAFLLMVIVCTIFFHHWNISFNMLTIIAFIIFLILAPFADKIKFFGIEFNRYKENNQKNKENL
jgi:hypothetical protein